MRTWLWMGLLLLLVFGHSASLFVLFPSWQGGSFWGFPVHYIVPILLGWFGLAVVSLAMALMCNKFDDEMDLLAEESRRQRRDEKK